MFKHRQNFWLGFMGIFFFLMIWEISSKLKWVNPLFISSPIEVLLEELELFKTGYIYSHLATSAQEFSIGFFLALILGISLGLLIGWYKKLESLTNPLVYSLYSTPTVALIPLIMIWLGLGIWSKVAVVFLAGFFPILITTIAAVKNLDPALIRLGRSFGANDRAIFKTIALPASLPFITAGIRLAVVRSLLGMVVAEFFVGNQGLGYLITFYGASFQTAKLLAVIMIIVGVSLLLNFAVGRIEKYFQKWRV